MNLVPEAVEQVPAREWKTYSGYVDSSIEWLGEVPAHWKLERFKNLVSSPARKEPEAARKLVALEHISSSTGDLVSDYVPEVVNVNDRILFKEGDVLFGKLRPYLKKFWLAEFYGCCPTELLVFRPRSESLEHRFLYYSIQSSYFIALANGSSYGVKMPRTSWEILGTQTMLMPPLPEQRAIAAFLNRETEIIDGLVERRERLISLLEEKKTALISHAVTKGLDPNAPTKYSGVEWLGEIPEEWEVSSLRYLAKVQLSNVDKSTEDHEPSIFLCNYVDVYYNDFITDSLNFMQASATQLEIDKFELQTGDVLITKDSESWDDIAVPAYVTDDLPNVLCGYHLAHIRPNEGVCGEYLFRSLQSHAISYQFEVNANGITRFGITGATISASTFLVPPLSEQQRIVDYLNIETGKIDTLISKLREHIEKLREYRTALISAVVTGKIDVRGEVRPQSTI